MSPIRVAVLVLFLSLPGGAQEVSDEALQAARKLRAASGLRVELFAAEPQFENPVCFSIAAWAESPANIVRSGA